MIGVEGSVRELEGSSVQPCWWSRTVDQSDKLSVQVLTGGVNLSTVRFTVVWSIFFSGFGVLSSKGVENHRNLDWCKGKRVELEKH